MTGSEPRTEMPDGNPPDWREIMSSSGRERSAGVAAAAHYVWQWMRAQAEASELQRTTLIMRGKLYVLQDSGGIPGFKWEGIFGWVMESVWPDISPEEASGGGQPGGFRAVIGWYLKGTHNIVCTFRGSARANPPRIPLYFIRDEWNPDAPRVGRSLIIPQLSPEADAVPQPQYMPSHEAPSRAAASATGEEWRCRVDWCRRAFSRESGRDHHERHYHPGILDTGPFCEACNDGPFKNEYGKTVHQRSCQRFIQMQAALQRDAEAHRPARQPQQAPAAAPDLPRSAMALLQQALSGESTGAAAELARLREENTRMKNAIRQAALLLVQAAGSE